ncbi:MAG TPA: response regulator [bacterium]|nr:response regulator [bacterium]HQP97197.1 response regulator [bacterium]
MRALIVDDSVLARAMLARALKESGIPEIDQAEDGFEAIEKIRENAYDLILMDCNMPNMTGLDTVRTIRNEGKEMPIIVVSCESDQRMVAEILSSGANDYIVKPFEPKTISGILRKVLPDLSKQDRDL